MSRDVSVASVLAVLDPAAALAGGSGEGDVPALDSEARDVKKLPIVATGKRANVTPPSPPPCSESDDEERPPVSDRPFKFPREVIHATRAVDTTAAVADADAAAGFTLGVAEPCPGELGLLRSPLAM